MFEIKWFVFFFNINQNMYNVSWLIWVEKIVNEVEKNMKYSTRFEKSLKINFLYIQRKSLSSFNAIWLNRQEKQQIHKQSSISLLFKQTICTTNCTSRQAFGLLVYVDDIVSEIISAGESVWRCNNTIIGHFVKQNKHQLSQ